MVAIQPDLTSTRRFGGNPLPISINCGDTTASAHIPHAGMQGADWGTDVDDPQTGRLREAEPSIRALQLRVVGAATPVHDIEPVVREPPSKV